MSGVEGSKQWIRCAADLPSLCEFSGGLSQSLNKPLISREMELPTGCWALLGTFVPSASWQSDQDRQKLWEEGLPRMLWMHIRLVPTFKLTHQQRQHLLGGWNTTAHDIIKRNNKKDYPTPALKNQKDSINNDKECLSGTSDKWGRYAPDKGDSQWQALAWIGTTSVSLV